MSIVNIKIRGSNYNLSCGEGQEEQLIELAKKYENRLNEFAKSIPRATDSLLFVMAGIIMEDKIRDMEALLKDKAKLPASEDEYSLSKSADIMAEYIENLSSKLDSMYS